MSVDTGIESIYVPLGEYHSRVHKNHNQACVQLPVNTTKGREIDKINGLLIPFL